MGNLVREPIFGLVVEEEFAKLMMAFQEEMEKRIMPRYLDHPKPKPKPKPPRK